MTLIQCCNYNLNVLVCYTQHSPSFSTQQPLEANIRPMELFRITELLKDPIGNDSEALCKE